MNIEQLSTQYIVRALTPEDAEMIYEALKNHTIFYKYHPPMVTPASILADMKVLPPNKGYEDKHYVGYFQGDTLIAVMDLIAHYPQHGSAFLGFFAVNSNLHGHGLGTKIISDAISSLAQQGFEKIRLGIDSGNPQSRAFWCKNGFSFTGEKQESGSSAILVMERAL